jgi:hypothetical protein
MPIINPHIFSLNGLTIRFTNQKNEY